MIIWSMARAVSRPLRRLRNGAGVSAPGQLLRSFFQAFSAWRAVGSSSGISRESSPLPARTRQASSLLLAGLAR
jgi:hypothetical protein